MKGDLQFILVKNQNVKILIEQQQKRKKGARGEKKKEKALD